MSHAQDTQIVILDYGSGNVGSVFNMLKSLTDNVSISSKVEDIAAASHLILPGVGAFSAVMAKMRANLPIEEIKHKIGEQKTPFLGICVGMQVLAELGQEFEPTQGFGFISGSIEEIDANGECLPHIGWNNLTDIQDCSLLKNISESDDFYFVHSYKFKALEQSHVMAKSFYGEEFCTVVNRDNIWGVQFHPEKSQEAGKTLLKNFIGLATC